MAYENNIPVQPMVIKYSQDISWTKEGGNPTPVQLNLYKNIEKLYGASHVICLPSYREGLPKGLIEAAAAGRAVVTTDVPGCRDAIIPNKTGLLVPIQNSIKLADALQWLIEHPKERANMGKAGRKFAEKEFAIEKIVQVHLDIYQELVDNKSFTRKT